MNTTARVLKCTCGMWMNYLGDFRDFSVWQCPDDHRLALVEIATEDIHRFVRTGVETADQPQPPRRRPR